MSSVPIPEGLERRLDAWKATGAVLWCLVYGWFAFIRSQRVPLLELMDVGVHELGHAIFWQLTHNELVMLVMGNGTQVLFPLVAGISFMLLKRNWVAFAMCLAWCGAALSDTAAYIYDAPRGDLALIGFSPIGDHGQALGDWARILGPEHFDKLYLADRLAADVRHAGVVLWVGSLVTLGLGLWWTWRRIHWLDAERRPPEAPTYRPLRPTSDVDMWRA